MRALDIEDRVTTISGKQYRVQVNGFAVPVNGKGYISVRIADGPKQGEWYVIGTVASQTDEFLRDIVCNPSSVALMDDEGNISFSTRMEN